MHSLLLLMEQKFMNAGWDCQNVAAPPVRPARPEIAPVEAEPERDFEPLYHVVLHDDDQHTYEYVILMLCEIFGYTELKSFKLACEVDETGVVIVATVHKELAELRVEQIREYTPEPPLPKCAGHMFATMEPAS